jgi:hypothetical protein
MMSLHHGWSWQPTQTASHIHIRLVQSVWAHWYAVHRHTAVAWNSFTHTTLTHILGYWVTCEVKMISLHHGWGWYPTQTASPIHIRYIQSVWEHWYAVHGQPAVASNSYIHTTWLIFWCSGSLDESKLCHYIMVEADSHLKLLPTSTFNAKCLGTFLCCPWAYGSSLWQPPQIAFCTSILDTYKVFEHIDMQFMCIWQ